MAAEMREQVDKDPGEIGAAERLGDASEAVSVGTTRGPMAGSFYLTGTTTFLARPTVSVCQDRLS